MDYLKRALGIDTKTADGVARYALRRFDDADQMAADDVVGVVEERAGDADGVRVDDVVARMRDESAPVDAEFRADLLANLFGLVDEYSNDPSQNGIAGELVGFLDAARTEDLLTDNGFENAQSAAEAGDIDRLRNIVGSDPLIQQAVTNGEIAQRVYQKQDGYPDTFPFEDVETGIERVQGWDDPPDDPGAFVSEWYRHVHGEEPGESKADADSDTDTMADTDSKQDDDGGDDGGPMSAVDLMEQLDEFSDEDVAAVERTAEMTGRDVEEVAGEIVSDRLDLPTGGSGGGDDDGADADMNADKGDDYDENDDGTDGMADADGDSGADAKSDVSDVPDDVVTADELDSKLESFRGEVVDSVTDAVTSDETVTQIGQKLGESEEAREAIADGLMDDVDEKLDAEGFVTPSPTQTADESSGKAADVLMGGGDD